MHKFTNNLISEKSPYLQQHAHNPVNWYPWCDEAFREAKEKDRPIFLSIGYSTCHWCHVMEHECFEDPEVARVMNETFISIKVDREDRPDLDSFYMRICQLMTGTGGWPLNIIMSPEKVPFLSLTYIPKESRGEQIGLIELTGRIKEIWHENKDGLIKGGSEALAELLRNEQEKSSLSVTAEVLGRAFTDMSSMFDPANGGFGSRPKFPTPHNIMFLLRIFSSTGNKNALDMATKTLHSMRLGGIYDHVGGGFHRYSTDSEWILPHFEKMAYDQALLAMAYTEAFQITHDKKFLETASSTLDFMIENMKAPEGGFFSAMDADSDGEEGKFYVWKYSDILDALGATDGELFSEVFHANPDGNYMDEATGRNPGKNVLYLTSSLEDVARGMHLDPVEFKDRIDEMIKKLRLYRAKRTEPFKDRKILSDINGLMITALTKAYRSFGTASFIESAIASEKFVRDKLFVGGRLHHSYIDGYLSPSGFLDDYANMIQGELELFLATGKTDFLSFAQELARQVDMLFEDKDNGGYFFSTGDATGTSIRLKEAYDGAIPSGNSVHMLNLLRLSLIMGDQSMLDKARRIADAFNSEIVKGAAFHSYMMIAVDYALSRNFLITIPENLPDHERIINELWAQFFPHAEFVLLNSDTSDILGGSNHVLGDEKIRSEISICTRNECLMPPRGVEEIVRVLSNK